MTEKLYLLVHLRVRDLAALTAEETIRKRVRGGEKLARLDRADLWEFTHTRPADFRDELHRLVGESNLFVNPNKHVFRFTGDYRAGWNEAVQLLTVRSREDLEGAVARETLAERYGITGLVAVRFAALWVFRLDGVSPGEEKRVVEELAVTRGPRSGLLVNPHYQVFTVESSLATDEVPNR